MGGHPLPPEAREMFGVEVERAWSPAEDDADRMKPMPLLIGITTEGEWLAGIFMWLDALEIQGPDGNTIPGAGIEKVASIRHLIVPPRYQGMGLAGRLLRKALLVADESGCTRIRSTAGFGCVDHLMMYDRLGFGRARSNERPYLVSRNVKTGSGK